MTTLHYIAEILGAVCVTVILPGLLLMLAHVMGG